jgi:hypothetical protein
MIIVIIVLESDEQSRLCTYCEEQCFSKTKSM